MEVNNTTTLKLDYNKYLKRYYKGFTYVEEHRDEFDKYYPEIMKIENCLVKIIAEIERIEKRKLSASEILQGFYDK